MTAPAKQPDRAVRAGSLGAIDQGIFSLGNLAFFLVLGRETSAATFATVATGMLIYETIQLVTRGAFAQPAAIVLPTLDSERANELAGSLLSAILRLATVVTILVAGIEWLVLEGTERNLMIWVALLFVPIMLQEGVRNIAFGTGRAMGAVKSDLVWTVMQVAGSAVLIVTEQATAGRLLGLWGAGAAVGAIVGLIALDVRITRSARPWTSAAKEYAPKLTAENALSATQTHAVSWLVLAIVGSVGVGTIRGIRTLFGPANAMGAGLRAAILPVMRRQMSSNSGARAFRAAGGLAAAIAGLAIVTAIAVAGLPMVWGEALLGETFESSQALAAPYGVLTVATAGVIASQVVLLSATQLRELIGARAILAVVTVVLVPIGASVWGTSGALWMAALATLLSMPAWILATRRVQTASTNRGEGPGSP